HARFHGRCGPTVRVCLSMTVRQEGRIEPPRAAGPGEEGGPVYSSNQPFTSRAKWTGAEVFACTRRAPVSDRPTRPLLARVRPGWKLSELVIGGAWSARNRLRLP